MLLLQYAPLPVGFQGSQVGYVKIIRQAFTQHRRLYKECDQLIFIEPGLKHDLGHFIMPVCVRITHHLLIMLAQAVAAGIVKGTRFPHSQSLLTWLSDNPWRLRKADNPILSIVLSSPTLTRMR